MLYLDPSRTPQGANIVYNFNPFSLSPSLFLSCNLTIRTRTPRTQNSSSPRTNLNILQDPSLRDEETEQIHLNHIERTPQNQILSTESLKSSDLKRPHLIPHHSLDCFLSRHNRLDQPREPVYQDSRTHLPLVSNHPLDL